MLDIFKDNFFLFDFFIGILSPAIVIILYSTKRIDRFIWYLFWAGAALGLTWELSCNINMIISTSYPVAKFLQPLPFHFMVIVLLHSFWDGGLFLIGIWLIYRICPSPHFSRFKFSELCVLLVWGQVQELCVELISTYFNGWAWLPYWWNPSLFKFNNHDITLFPQLIWFAAPIIFYFIALKLKSTLLKLKK